MNWCILAVIIIECVVAPSDVIAIVPDWQIMVGLWAAALATLWTRRFYVIL